MLPWILGHQNQIVQYLRNNYQDNQSHFRKPLQPYTNDIKTTALKKPAHFSWAVQL